MLQALFQLQIGTAHRQRHTEVSVTATSRQYPGDEQPELPSALDLHTGTGSSRALLHTGSALTSLSVMFRQTLLSVSVLVLRLLSDSGLARLALRSHDVPVRVLGRQATLHRPERRR